MHPFLAGALAGLTATGPMTAVMWALHRRLPAPQRHPLPPYHITMNLADQAGVREEMSAEARTASTYVGHFGYGAAAGSLYGPLVARVNAPPLVKGIGYGLAVWAGSYLGLLPAIGLHRPATREPRERNLLMIAAHVVWGATMGIVADQLSRNTRGHMSGVSARRGQLR